MLLRPGIQLPIQILDHIRGNFGTRERPNVTLFFLVQLQVIPGKKLDATFVFFSIRNWMRPLFFFRFNFIAHFILCTLISNCELFVVD